MMSTISKRRKNDKLPMLKFKLIDAGLKPYRGALQLQEELFNKNIAAKLVHQPTQNHLILCQHLPVFTIGKSGKKENIITGTDNLNAEFYQTNRGGDVTFHGPGQLVAYPILDLDTLRIGLAKYISNLEETIIQTLLQYGLKGERIKDAAGVWLHDEMGERKICAIGVKASRNITMHGLAMNVNNDLSYFDNIIPCGIADKGVTSLQKELKREVNFEEYKKVFVNAFAELFDLQ